MMRHFDTVCFHCIKAMVFSNCAKGVNIVLDNGRPLWRMILQLHDGALTCPVLPKLLELREHLQIKWGRVRRPKPETE